jgi:predicted acylesterase/phospholipase RssA
MIRSLYPDGGLNSHLPIDSEVEKGVYAWDGSLLSNTPLREVIEVSPVKDK